MSWIILIFAGLFEVMWATAMKQSDGFTKLWPAITTVAGMVASVGLLAVAMKSLPLGTAYTVWTGIGGVGAFVVGVMFLDEMLSFTKILAAGLIV